jgi:hypothetical protein
MEHKFVSAVNIFAGPPIGGSYTSNPSRKTTTNSRDAYRQIGISLCRLNFSSTKIQQKCALCNNTNVDL